MKLGVLFSGGKDSTYAAFLAKQQGHELACLISIISENKESYMFHTPNIELVELQAKAMNLPLLKQETKGEKEKELSDLKKAITLAKKKYQIRGIVTGAIASVYQFDRIRKICKALKIECINPLWQNDQEQILREIISQGFRVIISGIFAYPLDEKWLGREINDKVIDELVYLRDRFKLNPSGEGGEIETTVIDCPMFKKKIKILAHETKAEGNSGIFIIKKAELVDK